MSVPVWATARWGIITLEGKTGTERDALNGAWRFD